MGGLECSEVWLSETENSFTLGAEYYGKEYVDHVEKITHCSVYKPLGEISKMVTDGDHGSPNYQEDGVLYLLSESVKEGYIDSAKCRYITKEKNKELKRSCLHPGDIVVTKTGIYFGKSAVIPDSIAEANTIAHVGKITLKQGYNSYYVSTFFNSKYGYSQLRRRGIKATRPEIKLVEFPDIIVPIFSNAFDSVIEKNIRVANHLLELSERTMREAEQILLAALNIGDFLLPQKSVSIKSFSESFCADGRLDAEYYQPKYDQYKTFIGSAPKGFTEIREKFQAIKTKCDRTLPEYRYIEIGDINVSDGTVTANRIATENLPDNAKITASIGDVLVSTVRPNRGAVAILDLKDCLVSGAFVVLREKSDYKKETLSVLLRTRIYRDWLLRFNVGTSYPVIKADDVLNMPLPLLEDVIHQQISEKVQKAFLLRRQSKQTLKHAKRAVEIAIEQGEERALKWIDGKS